MVTFSDDSEHDRRIIAVAQLLVRFYDILNGESMFLGDAARAELPRLGQTLASLYATLSSDAFKTGQKLWKIQPKFHLFEHLTESQAIIFGNPRYWWTYGDEDLVGLMIDIAEGVHASTVAISTIVKWLNLLYEV